MAIVGRYIGQHGGWIDWMRCGSERGGHSESGSDVGHTRGVGRQLCSTRTSTTCPCIDAIKDRVQQVL